MKAFEEWWQVVPVEYTDVVNEDVAKAAYKAGMLRAAEIAEGMEGSWADLEWNQVCRDIAAATRKGAVEWQT